MPHRARTIRIGLFCLTGLLAAGLALGGDVTIDLMGFTLAGGTGSGIDASHALDAYRNVAVVNGAVIGWEHYGVDLGPNSLVRGLRAQDNGLVGISVGAQSAVIDCNASSNLSHGITTSLGATIHGCNAGFNRGDGIQVSQHALVLNNRCTGNGAFTSDGAGIHATSVGNRIDGNLLTGNDRGIDVDSAGNIIIRNTLTDNTVNLDIVAGNDIGPTGSAASATSPWANLVF